MPVELPEQLRNLLVIDIETVSASPSLEGLPPRLQAEWERKARRHDPDTGPDEQFLQRAALAAEFGRVIVIGLGYFLIQDKALAFRVKALTHDSEHELLNSFKKLIEDRFPQDTFRMVAHNGRDFDFPFICRRMVINGIDLPPSLQLMYRKPWEIPHLDTMQMWRFGEYRHPVSLELLGALLGVPSSKTDLDGSMVNQVYYQQEGLERITEYCKNDVIATARVFLKLNALPELADSAITRI